MSNFIIPRGGSTITSEKITLSSTIAGALASWAGMVAVRAGLLVYAAVWAIVTGRGAGAVILSAALLSLLRVGPGRVYVRADSFHAHRAVYLSALAFAVALTAAWLSGCWPRVWWQFGDGSLWLATARFSARVSPALTWARFLFIAGSAWVLWTPSKILHWVFKTEAVLPKARETTFAQADIASVHGPGGEPLAVSARRALPPEPDGAEDTGPVVVSVRQ